MIRPAMTTSSTTPGAVATTFVFIDSNIAGWQALADALPPGTNWRLIDAGADGLAQVAQALAGLRGVQAIHILSHGAEGSVQLGASVLTADSLAGRAADLAAIGAALDAEGDILLYGCTAGAGSAGAALVDTLAALTGADVAASTDMTGAAALGGNWVLERSSAAIGAQALGAGLDAWAGTLATSHTFGFTSGTTGATEFGGPYSMQVTQTAGDHVLVLQADAGTLAVVDESSYTGFDDPVLDGKTMAVDAAAPGAQLPTSISLRLADGKPFDLTALSLLDAAGTLSQLLITTDKGSVTVDVTRHGAGTTIVMPDNPFLKGITTALLSDPDGDTLVVQLDDIVLSNIRIPNPPAFEGASSSVDLAQNAAVFDLRSLLRASDADAGDTLTWSIAGNPVHGTVTIANATATVPSGSAAVTPGGTLAYTPAPGFAGTDSVTVQVSDGTASVSKTITIRVAPQQPGRPDLDALTDTGGSSTDNVTGSNRLKFAGAGASGDNDSTVRVFVDLNGNGAYDAGEASSTDRVSGGAWSVDNLSTTGLPSGTYNVYAVVTSADGTLSSSVSAPLAVTIDHTPPATTFGDFTLSADTGPGTADFITRVAAQTIGATLSAALQAGDVVQGSVNNGLDWIDVTSMVSGTSLTWTGATLVAGGRILLRVVDQHGNQGTATPRDYTLDTTAPTNGIAAAAFAGDSNNDGIVNASRQQLGGTLDANLAAGEFVEVSLNGGATWTTATASTGGRNWSLDDIDLSGDGTLKVRVADQAGNHGPEYERDYALDLAAPTATVPASRQLLAPAGASFTVTVTYADTGAGIDATTFGIGNIGVTKPGGGQLAVVGHAASGNVVTYTVQAPGGSWDAQDAGAYTVAINADAVRDLAGNAVAGNAAAGTIDVLFSTAPAVGALSLSDDSGISAADFLTNVGTQTIFATLSKALADGDVVEGSLDNGQNWTVITGKVAGTTLAWDGVVLDTGGTIVIKVTDAAGMAGAMASHAYTVDTGVPAQAVATAGFGADSGVGGDFITNVASQVVSGTLDAPLEAGEFVEISFNGGISWVAASAAGSQWSLAGVTLSGGGTLQVRVADAAGNHGSPWSHAYLLDTDAPTVGTPVRADLLDPAGASFTFTVTYADGGAGIDPSTIGIGNVSVAGPGGVLAVTGATANGSTVTYTVAAPGGSWDPLDAGSYTIGINAQVKDLAGNVVAAKPSAHIFTVDVNSAPVLGGVFATPAIGDNATATPFAGVTVTDPDGDVLTLGIGYAGANGVLSGAGLTGSAGNYTLSGSAADVQAALRALVFTPTANQVAAGSVATSFALVVSDGAASSSSSATVVTATPVAPTATITLSDTDFKAGESALLTITFSEAVAGFSAADLLLADATLGPLASSDGGRTWSATVTPVAGVALAAHQVLLDLSGVRDAGGLAGGGTVAGPHYTVSTVRPNAILSVSDPSLTAGETATLTVTFSEAVSGFTLADLRAASGALSNLSSGDGGITWTATLTPAVDAWTGANTVSLDLGGVMNAAGNAGSGSVQSNPYAVHTGAPPAPSPPPGVVIDGVRVTVERHTDPFTGLVSESIAVPIVSASRSDDPGSPNAPFADIPLAASAPGAGSTLTVSLPAGAGLQASAPVALLSTTLALADLIQRIQEKTAGGSGARADMLDGGDVFH